MVIISAWAGNWPEKPGRVVANVGKTQITGGTVNKSSDHPEGGKVYLHLFDGPTSSPEVVLPIYDRQSNQADFHFQFPGNGLIFTEGLEWCVCPETDYMPIQVEINWEPRLKENIPWK